MATLEDIERKLICSICLHVLSEPKLLTCGHTYCMRCLHSHICQMQTPEVLDNTLGFRCPVCREFVPAPDSSSPPLAWASQYRTNYIVQDLLDVHQDNSKRKNTCSVHQGKSLDLFCKNCDVIVCDRCVSLHHRACEDVVELLTIVKEIQILTNQQLSKVNSMITQCDRKRKRCDAGKCELDRIEQDVTEKVDRECHDVIQKVTTHILQEANRMKLEVKTQCEAGREMVRSYVGKCHELNLVLARMRVYLLHKNNQLSVTSPLRGEDEKRITSTLTTLSHAVTAIDSPCHFRVGLSLDDSALTKLLQELHLGKVTTLQISEAAQDITHAFSVPNVNASLSMMGLPTDNQSSSSCTTSPPSLSPSPAFSWP